MKAVALTRREAARAVRHQIERELDQLGTPWPWDAVRSIAIDLWIVIEEAA